MKVLVLAIDGLEAKLVERWNLKGFMQSYWGTHDVTTAVKPGDPLYTPLIWASFLLGEPAYKYGLSMKTIGNERLKAGYGILYPIYKLRVVVLGNRKLGVRELLTRIGLFSLRRVAKRMKEVERIPSKAIDKTIVKHVEKMGFKVWIEEFPTYNDDIVAEYRAMMSRYFDSPLDERLRKLDEVYEYSIKLLNRAVSALNSHELVFYYTPLIDHANHMLYRSSIRLRMLLHSYYKRLSNNVEKISKNINKHSALLIISDHGYNPRTHEHGNYGFWSLNLEPPIKPRTILDFYKLILALINI